MGTKGTHLFRQTNINAPDPNNNFQRPFPGFGPLLFQGENGNSIYHSFQLSASKRFDDGSGFLLAYTVGKVIDDTNESRRFTATAAGSVFNNRETARGLASFDRRQRLVISYDLPIPFTQNFTGWKKQTIGGWSISGVSTFEDGPPFSVTDPVSASAIDRTNGNQGNARSDLVPGVQAIFPNPTPERYLNRDAFTPAPSDRFGNQGRNIFHADGLVNFDFTVKKTIWLPRGGLNGIIGKDDGARLEFRAEFFNLFNHRNFDPPNTNLFSPAFGTVADQRINSRVIQFALKGFF